MEKALNCNQKLILSSVSRNLNCTASAFLRKLSKDSGVPLSTLKLNLKILKEEGLVEYGRVGEPRPIKLTEVGKIVLELLDCQRNVKCDGDCEKSILEEDCRELPSKIRSKIVFEIYQAKMGHLPSSLSSANIIAAIFQVFKPNVIGSKNYFILSKGHAAPALYAVMAQQGILDDYELAFLCSIGSRLQGHPDKRFLPEVIVSTGSLGQGLSVGVGIAIGKKLKNVGGKVVVLLGDGELEEGQIWEAAMSASANNLDNLIAVIDRNFYQMNGATEEVKMLEPLSSKWKSFGWDVIEVDGRKIGELVYILKEIEKHQRKPTAIIAFTERNGGIEHIDRKAFYYIPTHEEYVRIWGKQIG
ncbi:MAG: 1-deoxy-D-xylulose-5-phosphate synthase N-terminal domain-containing protein [Nitrososphaeria archaeon]